MPEMIFETMHPDKLFLKNPVAKTSVSYAQLYQHAWRLTAFFQESNIQKGNTVLIVLKTAENYMPVLLGCWIAEIIPAIYSPNAAGSSYSETLNDFSFDYVISDLDFVFDGIDSKTIIRIGTKREDTFSAPAKDVFRVMVAKQQIALFLFSSGTSGKQKCIPLSFDNLAANISSFAKRLALGESSEFLCGSPLWHAHGLYNSFITTFFLNATVIYSGPFSLLNVNILFNEVVEKKNIVFHITPSMIPILLLYAQKNKDNPLPEFYKVICGTSFLDMEKKKELEETYHVKLLQQYGMTETLFMTVNAAYSAEKPKSVGQVLDGTHIEIVADNKVIGINETGNIRVKTNSCFGSYYGSNSNANTDFREGFFYTGDIGYFDEENCLFITGREKDMIKKGGFSISANSITELLQTFPGISEAYTIGVNDPVVGEEIYSFYISDELINENEMKNFLKKKIAANLLPKKIFQVKEFPKTATGKIMKTQMHDLVNELL